MGNLVALCKANLGSCYIRVRTTEQQRQVEQIVKLDGKVLQFASPVQVEGALAHGSAGWGFSLSSGDSKPLPSGQDLKLGEVQCALPPATGEIDRAPSFTFPRTTGGAKRIKIVITKQQLQQLLTKKVPIEEALSDLKRGDSQGIDSPRNWRPRLESVPEGND